MIKDFTADFSTISWCVSWRCIDQTITPRLKNNVAQYRMSRWRKLSRKKLKDDRKRLVTSVKAFYGEHDGIIPMLAVVQPNKDKVRPVVDFRELNGYISSHTGQSVVCGEKLRE